MAYEWGEAAQGGQTEKMTNGYHYAHMDRIIVGSKGKGLFKSKSGDPQIMVVFKENDGTESSSMLTLSNKAGWTLARLLSCCGVDLDKLKLDGIEPAHFANEALAKSYLVGKDVWIKVDTGSDPKYQNVEPLHAEDVPVDVRTANPLIGDDTNPFA